MGVRGIFCNFAGMKYTCEILGNELKVAVARTDARVAYIGATVGSGSRDEQPGRYGLAHFVEHTVFKGTCKRRSAAVSRRMESIGGELNACTSKEDTTLYTCAPAGNAERAIELLADIVANSTFPAPELATEREVVAEEIKSYLDTPSENVYDEYEERIFRGSALAHNILGTEESVRTLTGSDCRDFLDRNYTPDNMTVYVSAPEDAERMMKLVEKHFGHLRFQCRRPEREAPEEVAPFSDVVDDDGYQAHTIYGARTFSRYDERRFALYLLNNYLGGPCMGSRLNAELREKRGLVYSVDSFVSNFSDAGLLSVYIGCDRKNVGKCLRIVRRELDRLIEKRLTDRQLEQIKKQYCGQLLVSTDNRENMAMGMGKSMLYHGRVYDPEHTAERIMAVTAEEVRDVAQLLEAGRCSRLTMM